MKKEMKSSDIVRLLELQAQALLSAIVLYRYGIEPISSLKIRAKMFAKSINEVIK